MTLREFFEVLRTRWKAIVLVTLVVVGVSAAVTYRTTPTYTANAKFYLAAQNDSSKAGRGAYIVTPADLETYVAVLGSPSVMVPLRERLDLPPGTPLAVSAAVSGDTSILDVTAKSADPRLAARIANATGPQLAAVAAKFSALLQASGQTIEATTISPAVAPSSPSSPNVERNLAVAVLAGLFLGIGLAFVRHALDTKVRSEADVRAHSTSPVLSELPATRVTSRGLALEVESRGAYAEAIRRLRTNLMFVDVTTGHHSFVVTSSVPGEGKTTTAVNLAHAMAQAGGRVLLVDADLRNPSVARVLGLEGSVGLTTVLLGQAGVDEVVQRWKQSDLYVMTSGPVPPNPSELLGSEPMKELFEKLGNDYDFILVDSPPLVPVIDAVLINNLTRGMVMVVAHNRTKKRELASATKTLGTVDAKVSGFAMNFVSGADTDAQRYGNYGVTPGKKRKAKGRSDAEQA